MKKFNPVDYLFNKVGNTPCVSIPSMFNDNHIITLKLENENPSGTIKDRLAKYIINNNANAEVFVDTSIGNFSISLSWFASISNKKAIIFVNLNEDINILEKIKKYGGDIIFTDAKSQLEISDVAEKYAEDHGYFFCGQYSNSSYKDKIGKQLYNEIKNLEFDSIISYLGTGISTLGLFEILKESKVKFYKSSSEFTPLIKRHDNVIQTQFVDYEYVLSVQEYLIKKCGIKSGVIGATNVATTMYLLNKETIKKPLTFITDLPN